MRARTMQSGPHILVRMQPWRRAAPASEEEVRSASPFRRELQMTKMHILRTGVCEPTDIYIPKAKQPCLCVRLEHDGARSRVPATTKDATFDLGPKWILYKQPFTD